MKSSLISLVFATLLSISNSHAQNVLVISGGGARGAWGGGVAEHLVTEQGMDYQAILGTSTGSLMAPLIAVEDFELLKDTYTNVKQRSIFNVNPFKTTKDQGEVVSIKPKYLKAIFRIVFGKKTLGESKNLRKLLDQTYDIDTYERILTEGDNFFITVANFSTADIFYFNSKQEAFNSRSISCEGKTGSQLKKCQQEKDEKRMAMLDWIWRSANQPLFMTLDCTDEAISDGENHLVEGRNCWVDGGIRENIPILRGIQYVLDHDSEFEGVPTIDVIVNNRPTIDLEPIKRRRILNSLFRTVGILTFDVRDNDRNLPAEMERAYHLEMAKQGLSYESDVPYININLYFMPDGVYELHKWDLYFEKEGMSRLWEAGQAMEVMHVPMQLSKEVAELLLEKGRQSRELY